MLLLSKLSLQRRDDLQLDLEIKQKLYYWHINHRLKINVSFYTTLFLYCYFYNIICVNDNFDTLIRKKKPTPFKQILQEEKNLHFFL